MKRSRFRLPEHPRLWIKRPPTHLGRRGAVLLILGVIWLLIGVSTIIDPDALGGPHLGLFHEALPSWLRATLWIGTALLALSSAWRVASRRDDWGYMGLILMPIVYTASYGWAWMIHLTGGHGDPTGWLVALVWSTIAVLVFTISGWPETPSFILPLEGDDDALE